MIFHIFRTIKVKQNNFRQLLYQLNTVGIPYKMVPNDFLCLLHPVKLYQLIFRMLYSRTSLCGQGQ